MPPDNALVPVPERGPGDERAAGALCALAACGLCGDCARVAPVGPIPAEGAAGETVAAKRLRAGQLLYRAGHLGEAVFALRAGLVKETVALSGDKRGAGERIVRLVGAGGITGLAALAGEPHRHAAVVAGEALCCRIPVALLRRAVAHHASGARAIWSGWLRALDDADLMIAGFASGPAQARLARLVLYLLHQQGASARLRRRDAAALIGITPVSISRLISQFKRAGWIDERNGQLMATDPDALAWVAHASRGPSRDGAAVVAVSAR